jgi:Protein of unknown function (DUF2637)
VTGILRTPRRAALAAIAVLVAAASLTSFAESYRGLYAWAGEHGLAGPWAVIWPLQVDVFIAVGELALFVALADAWDRRSRFGAWAVTLAGLAVSVAGNVGHVHGHSVPDRVTAAVPPVAAAAALAVGLGVLKRVVEAHHRQAVPAAVPAGVPVPGVREIRDRRNCSQATAEKIRAELKLLTRPPAGRALAPGARTPAGVSVNGHQPAEGSKS